MGDRLETGGTLASVRRIVSEVRGLAAPVRPDDLLGRDAGCTSFDMMVVLVRIEEELGVETDFDRLAGVKTVADLASAVDAARAGG